MLHFVKRIKDRLTHGPVDLALGSGLDSYEAPVLCQVIAAKTVCYSTAVRGSPADDPMLFVALAEQPQKLRVLDFGGACGVHYFQAQAWAPRHYEWWVVETPAMCSASRVIHEEALRFTTDLAKVPRPIDLLIASGSVQYAPDPLTMLEQLLKSEAPRILISRLPLATNSATERLIQHSRLAHNGPGPLPDGFTDAPVQYPVTIVPRVDVERAITDAGYRIAGSFSDSSGSIGPHAARAYLCVR